MTIKKRRRLRQPCIYCGAELVQKRSEGDHVLPLSLGDFIDGPKFYSICRACNATIGKSEQQMINCGPESVYRFYIKPSNPKRRNLGRNFKGAHGAAPPLHLGWYKNEPRLVRPIPGDPINVLPIDQLVVFFEDDSFEALELHPELTTGSLRKKLNRLQESREAKIQSISVEANHERHESFISLLKEIWPDGKLVREPPTEKGIHPTKGQIQLTVNFHYFRAIAKIGFHFYLVHNQRNHQGNEPCFDEIRRFIISGDNPDHLIKNGNFKFNTVHKAWLDNIDRKYKAFHLLAISDFNAEIFAFVSLFHGIDSQQTSYSIRLGDVAGSLLLPDYRFGQAFCYFKDQPESGFAGECLQFPSLA